VIPEAFILMDHMLNSMTRILSGLRVKADRMLENLTKYKDPMMSESVMIALVRKGLPRQEAHRLLQQVVFESEDKKQSFHDVLLSNPTVSKYLTEDEVKAALDPKLYIGMSMELVDAAVEKTIAERRKRGLPS
jgi:adenylosuccinate lyase